MAWTRLGTALTTSFLCSELSKPLVQMRSLNSKSVGPIWILEEICVRPQLKKEVTTIYWESVIGRRLISLKAISHL